MLGSRRNVMSHAEVVLSFAALVAVATGLYGALWWWDFGSNGALPSSLFLQPGAIQSLSNFGDVTVAVLGVSLTVVTIIVELASNRYTPRITELFVRDPVNALMMGFYVVTAVLVIWVEMSLYGGHHPQAMVAVALGAMSVSLLTLLPYFAYVFDFLLPTRIVGRIAQRSANAIRRVRRRGIVAIPSARTEVLTAIEQLGDIALNSVAQNDKNISISALAALVDLAEAYLVEKPHLPTSWFDAGFLVDHDQDFVSMHPDVIRGLETRRTWVEMKILRQMQPVFEESLLKMRDINHLVAIHARRLATAAAGAHDPHALALVVKFMNTFMRAALNARDQRAAYNLMNEYRLLGESLLGLGLSDEVVELSERCRYYGQTAFKAKLPFILETVAYDLCSLLETAHAAGAPAHERLLATFLELDRTPEADSVQEASLRGVRKAQIKLATWYLSRGDDALARRIWEDMRHEPVSRMLSIQAELGGVVEADFWEVSDRGGNFEYLPPERRELMRQFFAWFDPPRAVEG